MTTTCRLFEHAVRAAIGRGDAGRESVVLSMGWTGQEEEQEEDWEDDGGGGGDERGYHRTFVLVSIVLMTTFHRCTYLPSRGKLID